MTIKGIFYISLFASDFERSKQFYSQTLGWTLGTDEPGLAGFHFGSGYLVLIAETRDESSRTYGGGMHVEVQVEDVRGQHERLKTLGVNPGELQQQVWGECNFSFTDPDGYIWSYGQA